MKGCELLDAMIADEKAAGPGYDQLNKALQQQVGPLEGTMVNVIMSEHAADENKHYGALTRLKAILQC